MKTIFLAPSSEESAPVGKFLAPTLVFWSNSLDPFSSNLISPQNVNKVMLCLARLCTNSGYSYTHIFEFEENSRFHFSKYKVKGSMNAYMRLVLFSIFGKVEDYRSSLQS